MTSKREQAQQEILVLERLEPLGFRDLHPAVLGSPAVKGLLSDTVPSRQLPNLDLGSGRLVQCR